MVAMRNTIPVWVTVHEDCASGLGRAGTARPFCASIGPGRGPLIYSEALLAIAVTRSRRTRTPIGTALCVGRDETGMALWELTIGNVEVPGRWVVLDREFRRPESAAGSAFTLPEPWPDQLR
jgi:hypothetical protein